MEQDSHKFEYVITTYRPIVFACLIFAMLLYSCQKDTPGPELCEPVALQQLNEEQQVFLDICFGNEFGEPYERIRKWGEDIRIFVPEPMPELEEELNNIVAEINQLSETTQLSIVQDKDAANLIAFFGRKIVYALQYEPSAMDLIDTNNGLFSVRWNTGTYLISGGSICVDTERETNLDCLKHLLREELTQALGMMNDTDAYEESIFYSTYTCGIQYSELDKQYIRDFMSEKVRAGMCPQEVVDVLF